MGKVPHVINGKAQNTDLGVDGVADFRNATQYFH